MTLIEKILNEELSLLIEKRRGYRRNKRGKRTGRRSSRRMTRKQRRQVAYNRAFNNTGIDEKGVQQLIRYIAVTSRGLQNKQYSWSLTRTVWAAKKICEFAKTLKKPINGLDKVKEAWAPYYQEFAKTMSDFVLSADITDANREDIGKRTNYIQSFLNKAKRYGERNKNGWNDVVS